LKLLFISHDATLTGAPILLLNLIRIIKIDARYSIKIVLKNEEGSLIPDFKKEADLLVWRPSFRPGVFDRAMHKAGRLLKLRTANEKMIQTWIDDSDCIISNTITNGDFLACFDFSKNKKVFSYVHELEMATHWYTNKKDIEAVKAVTRHYLAPSAAVAGHLTGNLQIPPDNISILNYYIPFAGDEPGTVKKNTKFVVGLVGTLDWRKGADILTVVVSSLFKKNPAPDLQFVWKGADTKSIDCERIVYELHKMGLGNKVRFEPPDKNVAPFYQSIDLLLLLSKEDPYPLVVLEAAGNYKPCICFDKAGGAPEFVGADAGEVIPYLDIELLTEKLLLYYTDRERCIQKGNAAHEKYLAKHFNPALIMSQFNSALAKQS